jgi:thiosulfate/3-mercaptopyruvate sulfurtransferase
VRDLITPAELVRHLHEVTVLDVRWELGRDDGEQQFLSGHVPGSSYVDLERDLADPAARPVDPRGRHPLPSAARFAAAMRCSGVSASRAVVVLDAGGGAAAARCWWLLRHHGHDHVRLLDGGWAGWQRRGLPVATGPHRAEPGDFTATPGRLPVIGADEAAGVAGQGVLLDARTPERFRGEQEPVDPVAGHVPGAHNLPATANLTADGARLRSEDELRARYAEALDAADRGRPVAVYCGSGVTASLDVLVLHSLGVDAALYAGSWSGWTSDADRPVATGR